MNVHVLSLIWHFTDGIERLPGTVYESNDPALVDLCRLGFVEFWLPGSPRVTREWLHRRFSNESDSIAYVPLPEAPPNDRRCQWIHESKGRCEGGRGVHPRFCWNHRSPEERAAHRKRQREIAAAAALEPPRRPLPTHLAKPRHRARLTDEDCWRQRVSWQRNEAHREWHRELELRPEQPPTQCAACGSHDVIWNGDTYWCNWCDAQVDPDDPGADLVTVWECTLPLVPFPIARPDDADYREATRLFHAGALSNRPYGWISPKWDRTKEGRLSNPRGRANKARWRPHERS